MRRGLKERYDSQHLDSPEMSHKEQVIEDLRRTRHLFKRYGIAGTLVISISKFRKIKAVDAVDGIYLDT